MGKAYADHRAASRLESLERRFSVKEFDSAPLSLQTYLQLKQRITDKPSALFKDSPSLRIYAIPGRIGGLFNPEIECTDTRSRAWTHVRAIADECVVERWVSACQNQTILDKAACLFCIGIAKGQLASAPHNVYRHAVIDAGWVVGHMYSTATQLEVATTAIGGFSDKAITDLIGVADFLPIVIQAFGLNGNAARKVDMARVVTGEIN